MGTDGFLVGFCLKSEQKQVWFIEFSCDLLDSPINIDSFLPAFSDNSKFKCLQAENYVKIFETNFFGKGAWLAVCLGFNGVYLRNELFASSL